MRKSLESNTFGKNSGVDQHDASDLVYLNPYGTLKGPFTSSGFVIEKSRSLEKH